MAVQDYATLAQTLYVTYFGRPGDYFGMQSFQKQLNDMKAPTDLATLSALTQADKAGTTALSKLVNSFSASPEATAMYGTDTSALGVSKFVEAIYLHVLNRAPDAAGWAFWVDAITSGALPRATAAAAIADGAVHNTSTQGLLDAKTVANKIAVATDFTNSLVTVAQINGYAGNDAAAAARDMLAGVDAKTVVADFHATVVATVDAVVAASIPSTTFNLTTGVDDIVGGNGNDVINGLIDATGATPKTTLTALDTINGGAGSDTLAITALTDITSAPNISVSGVEVVTIRAAGAVSADISTWSGVEQFNITEATGNVALGASATTNINATLKANGASTTTINGGKDVVVKQSGVNATTQDITVGNVTAAKGTVNVESTGAAAAHGTNIVMGDIAVTGGTTINVTQIASGDTSGLKIGATALHTQGNVTVTGNGSTTAVTVNQTAAISARAGIADVAEVVETASVKFAAMTAGQTLTAAGLTFTASKNLTAAEVASTFANLIKGTVPVAGDTQGSGLASNGTYTGSLTGWTSGAVNGDTVVFTSTVGGVVTDLSFTGTATGPVVTTVQGVDEDGQAARLGVAVGTVVVNDAAGTIKNITINGYANGSSITGGAVLDTLKLSNAAAGVGITVADSASTLALDLEKVGTSSGDAAITITAAPTTLNVKSTGNNYVDLSANATETLNVSGTGVFKADVVALGALKTVKVTETAGLTLGAGAAATLTNVDTTGTTGTVKTSIDGTKATYTGGAGVDSVSVTTATVTKAITTGAGNDSVTLADGTIAIATEGSINGGDGTDTLEMLAANAVTASQGTTFASKVTGFEKLTVRGATGAQEIETDVLGNYNDVTVKAAVGGSALTLDGMTSGATIRFSDNSNVSTIVKIKDADKSTTDVLNIAITATGAVNGAADSNGSVTAAEVETINISTADGLTESPTNLAADTQNLTLVATKAKTIVVTGNTALNLTNAGNINVSAIDASAMTAALTVQAAGNTVTTITGGSGNDVLTASETALGNVAQVSTLTLTNGTGAAQMAAGDSISVTVAGQLVTQAFNTDYATTLGLLNTAINNLAAVNSVLVGDVITITAATAGTSFTANTVITSASATSGVTSTYAEGAVNSVKDVDTIVFTDGGTAMQAGQNVSIDVDGVTYTQAFTTDFDTTMAALAAQVAAANGGNDFTAAYDNASNTMTITGKAGVGAFATTNALYTGATTATGVAAEGAVNHVADADTLVVAESPNMGAGDTIAVAVTNADGTMSTVAIAFNTNLDTTMADVATAIAALGGGAVYTAGYVAGTNTLTVTDATGADKAITNIALTFVDKVATSVTSSFTTTTSNVAVTAAADVLIGGAGNDTLISKQGLATLTGGAGHDLFQVGSASLNVNSYATVTDFTADDLIQFVGADSFVAAKLTLGATAVFQDYANAAVNSVGANDLAWFQYNGDTYVVMDVATTDSTAFLNGEDMIVKITGSVDLTNASFNATHGTIGLI